MQIKPKIKMTKASYVAYRTTYDELAAILKQIKAAHVTDKTTSDGERSNKRGSSLKMHRSLKVPRWKRR